MNPDRTAYDATISEIQHLMRDQVPDGESLVRALLAERREASKIEHAEFLVDERFPLEERQRFGSPLTIDEIKALQTSGVNPDYKLDPDYDPELLALRELARLLIESLTIDQAADRLNVLPATIASMAKTRQLYWLNEEFGLKRFPTFQFSDRGLLQGFIIVGPAIPTSLSVLEVSSWFRIENAELYIDDNPNQTLSPRNWLLSGRDPKAVLRELEYWDH